MFSYRFSKPTFYDISDGSALGYFIGNNKGKAWALKPVWQPLQQPVP